jgi:hypothetical protein
MYFDSFTTQEMHRFDMEGEASLHGDFMSCYRRQQMKGPERLTDRDI